MGSSETRRHLEELHEIEQMSEEEIRQEIKRMEGISDV